eukprot:1144275-Pelagomonas_calceolata.AAC.6
MSPSPVHHFVITCPPLVPCWSNCTASLQLCGSWKMYAGSATRTWLQLYGCMKRTFLARALQVGTEKMESFS